MINEEHMVNDGLDHSCANNGQTTWTYNQGVILGALAELSRISGDEQYVRRAEQIADATIAALVSSGAILTEACEPHDCNGDTQVFKGIFVQGLANLYSAVHPGKPEYRAFLVANADALWQSARHGRDGFGPSWAAPTGPVTAATQTAAALLTGAVALLPAVAES
jgi:predicted alpha-1,6-mannanase (GH76 family)